jgi:hypothetical protein
MDSWQTVTYKKSKSSTSSTSSVSSASVSVSKFKRPMTDKEIKGNPFHALVDKDRYVTKFGILQFKTNRRGEFVLHNLTNGQVYTDVNIELVEIQRAKPSFKVTMRLVQSVRPILTKPSLDLVEELPETD